MEQIIYMEYTSHLLHQIEKLLQRMRIIFVFNLFIFFKKAMGIRNRECDGFGTPVFHSSEKSVFNRTKVLSSLTIESICFGKVQ
jgi:hypothetical protein